MKSVLPDTNVIIDLLAGDKTFEEALSTAERIIVTPTVVAEFLAGISPSARDKAKKAAFDDFLEDEVVEVVSHDVETASYYASIYRYLATNGTPIPLNDVWIAASAMQHGATIITKDHHFSSIPVLPVTIG